MFEYPYITIYSRLLNGGKYIFLSIILDNKCVKYSITRPKKCGFVFLIPCSRCVVFSFLLVPFFTTIRMIPPCQFDFKELVDTEFGIFPCTMKEISNTQRTRNKHSSSSGGQGRCCRSPDVLCIIDMGRFINNKKRNCFTTDAAVTG